MNKLFLLFIIAFFILSCKSKTLIPNFQFEMKEGVWKDTINDMIKRGELNKDSLGDDSLTWRYKLQVGDTFINTHVMINRDGINHGTLRILVFHLTNDEGIIKPNPMSSNNSYSTHSEDSALFDELTQEGFFLDRTPEGKISYLGASVFPKILSEKLFNDLKKKYGSPDSILDNDRVSNSSVSF